MYISVYSNYIYIYDISVYSIYLSFFAKSLNEPIMTTFKAEDNLNLESSYLKRFKQSLQSYTLWVYFLKTALRERPAI